MSKIKKLLLFSFTFTLFLALTACNTTQSSSSSGNVDKEAIIEHFKTMNAATLPPGLDFAITDFVPSEIQNVLVATLNLSQGDRAENVPIYLLGNNRFYFLGKIFDLQNDPAKENLSKIDLSEAIFKGNKDAKVSMVVYTNFQCPYCKNAHEQIKSNFQAYENDIRYAIKHLPLNDAQWADLAAIAVQCAGFQEEKAYWQITDKIFSESSQINENNIKQKVLDYAKDTNLDIQKFTQCYDNKESNDLIKKDVAEAMLIGIRGTPAIFVNGRQVAYTGFNSISDIIESELVKLKK